MKKLKLPKPKEIGTALFNLSIVQGVIRWSKYNSLPGFYKVPIYDVIVFVFREIRRFDLLTRANSMAFSFFLSLFPSLISLFTLLPFLRRYLLTFLPDSGEDFDEILKTQIQEFLPGNVGKTLSDFIEDLITNPRVGLLSAGFFLAIFFASNGMMGMMRGFEKSNSRTFKKRKPLRKRGVAIFLTLQLGILMISSVILIIVANLIMYWLTDLLNLSTSTAYLILFIRWFVIILLFYIVISIIYRYGAATRERFRLITPGATLATSLSILSSIGFSYYVNNFSFYNELYGSLGTIIVLMLWIQINSLILLIGFELNASIAINKDLKKRIPEAEEL